MRTLSVERVWAEHQRRFQRGELVGQELHAVCPMRRLGGSRLQGNSKQSSLGQNERLEANARTGSKKFFGARELLIGIAAVCHGDADHAPARFLDEPQWQTTANAFIVWMRRNNDAHWRLRIRRALRMSGDPFTCQPCHFKWWQCFGSSQQRLQCPRKVAQWLRGVCSVHERRSASHSRANMAYTKVSRIVP